MDPTRQRGELQGLMVMLASLSHGLEEVSGRGARSIMYRAGKNVGLKIKTDARSSDPIETVALVGKVLQSRGVGWQVTPWKPKDAASYIYEKNAETMAMKVVCRNCMIRCALFRYSHEQQQSLCMMNQGEFSGIFQQITGKPANLEIIHAGENACLKEMSWAKK